jgi:hypothetical protein
MHEAAWVVGLLVLIGAYASIGVVPWYDLVMLGQALMLWAATFGVPLELLYFAALALALRANGQAPKGWYWRSFAHHHLLESSQKPWVLAPFYAGALAFVAIALGIGLVLFGFLVGAINYDAP